MSEKKQQITALPLLHKNARHQDILILDRLNKELEDGRDQIAALNKELDQRFTEVATLTRLLLEKDQDLDQLSSDLNDKNHQLKQLSDQYLSQTADFNAKQSEIDKLADSIEFKNIQNDDLAIKIKILQNLSSDLQIALDNKNQQTEVLQIALDDKIQQIEALQNLRIALSATIELKNQAFDDISSQAATKDVNLESLSLHQAQVEDELLSRDSEIAYLKNELHSVYTSTSWQVTAPLRYIKRLIGFTAQ